MKHKTELGMATLSPLPFPLLDDIAKFSDSWEGHMTNLSEVLNRLRQSGLTIRAEKCELGRVELIYLDHAVGQGFRGP